MKVLVDTCVWSLALRRKTGPLKPGTLKPGTLKSGTLKPGTLKSGTLKPGTLKPGTLKPEEQILLTSLTRAIQDGRVAIVGPIRQELLSGIRDQAQFEKVRETLESFPD